MRLERHEEWQAIQGFDNYIISSSGRVMNVKTKKILKPHLSSGLRKSGRPKKRYLSVRLYKDGKRSRPEYSIHRLMLSAFVRNPREFEIGCHRNDNTFDNRLENLYWGTHKQNMDDMFENGNNYHPGVGYGENHPRSKLSAEDVQKIRSEYTGKRGQIAEFARKYGLTAASMRGVVHNKSYRGVMKSITKHSRITPC